MSPNNRDDDPLIAALRDLPTCDVSAARARRLRSRCQRELHAQRSSGHVLQDTGAAVWRRSLGVLAGAWCVLYLLEIIREVARVWTF